MQELQSVYQKHVERQGFTIDPMQQEAVRQLQRLYDDWSRYWRGGLLRKLLNRRLPTYAGFYLWGGVGCGKTMLLDLFFSRMLSERGQRMHFHLFMRMVHRRLRELKNKSDPLRRMARMLSRRTQVFYLDEFQVNNIGDAMILAELLDALCSCRTLILLSSNHKPQALYHDGLQRARFLPTIALLEEKFHVFELLGQHDYRLRYIHKAGLYRTPHNNAASAWLEESFHKLSGGDTIHRQALDVNGRKINTVAYCGHCAWFRFSELCGTPRSAADYIEIANLFETVLLSEIQILTGKDDIVRRFINLIDAFYDCKVRLIASAADFAHGLYGSDGLYAGDFKRTVSRLTEMQSDTYWQYKHTFKERLSQAGASTAQQKRN